MSNFHQTICKSVLLETTIIIRQIICHNGYSFHKRVISIFFKCRVPPAHIQPGKPYHIIVPKTLPNFVFLETTINHKCAQIMYLITNDLCGEQVFKALLARLMAYILILCVFEMGGLSVMSLPSHISIIFLLSQKLNIAYVLRVIYL